LDIDLYHLWWGTGLIRLFPTSAWGYLGTSLIFCVRRVPVGTMFLPQPGGIWGTSIVFCEHRVPTYPVFVWSIYIRI
jgi:hypothetical protein